MMKIKLITLSLIALLTGCASNQPFSSEQIAIIKTYPTVVQALPKDQKESLAIYKHSEKIGSEVAGLALGLLTGSLGYHSDGKTPRTRFDDSSLNQFIKNSERRAMAETVETITPTQVMVEALANQFSRADTMNENNMTISVKPVVWHLFYDKHTDEQETFFLEYAGDITLSLPAEKFNRTFPCDKSSEQALTREDWFANDGLRIRGFANDVAQKCIAQIQSELGITDAKEAL